MTSSPAAKASLATQFRAWCQRHPLVLAGAFFGLILLLLSITDARNIDRSEYREIELGMAYEDVVEIVGGEGELIEETRRTGLKLSRYRWPGETAKIAGRRSMPREVFLTFHEGKLVAK